MKVVTYSYTRIPTDEGIIYRPIIPIKVIHQKIEFPFLELIDSGADECSFPGVVGETLQNMPNDSEAYVHYFNEFCQKVQKAFQFLLTL